MPDLKETVLPVLAWVALAIAIALAATTFYLADFRQDCQADGGHFELDGGTAWCRY